MSKNCSALQFLDIFSLKYLFAETFCRIFTLHKESPTSAFYIFIDFL